VRTQASMAAVQIPQAWGNDGALARVDTALATLSGVELALLPELCLTGYVSPWGDFDVRPFAETLDGPTCREVAALAARRNLAIAAPLVERVEGNLSRDTRYYNTLVLFDETGLRIGHWRKRHPWFPEYWATPGDLGTPVIEWHGLSIAAAICYDLHFLDHEAADELQSADVLLFPSAWVEDEEDTRLPRLRELAGRYGIAVVNANWATGRPAIWGQGGSVILDPQGEVLAAAAGNGAECITAYIQRRASGG